MPYKEGMSTRQMNPEEKEKERKKKLDQDTGSKWNQVQVKRSHNGMIPEDKVKHDTPKQ